MAMRPVDPRVKEWQTQIGMLVDGMWSNVDGMKVWERLNELKSWIEAAELKRWGQTVNPQTGRVIGLDSKTLNRLLRDGFIMDEEHNIICPPLPRRTQTPQ